MKTTHNIEPSTDGRQVGEVATALKDLLRNYSHVAYVVGVKQSRTVKNWAERGVKPADPLMESRLRVAEALATTVKDKSRPWVSATWLICNNPHLEEEVPCDLIQSLQGNETDVPIVERLEFAATVFAAWEDDFENSEA